MIPRKISVDKFTDSLEISERNVGKTFDLKMSFSIVHWPVVNIPQKISSGGKIVEIIFERKTHEMIKLMKTYRKTSAKLYGTEPANLEIEFNILENAKTSEDLVSVYRQMLDMKKSVEGEIFKKNAVEPVFKLDETICSSTITRIRNGIIDYLKICNTEYVRILIVRFLAEIKSVVFIIRLPRQNSSKFDARIYPENHDYNL